MCGALYLYKCYHMISMCIFFFTIPGYLLRFPVGKLWNLVFQREILNCYLKGEENERAKFYWLTFEDCHLNLVNSLPLAFFKYVTFNFSMQISSQFSLPYISMTSVLFPKWDRGLLQIIGISESLYLFIVVAVVFSSVFWAHANIPILVFPL